MDKKIFLKGKIMRSKLASKLCRLFILLLAVNVGCVMEDVSSPSEGEDGESSYTYAGCIDGQGVGTNSIQINFLFPSAATRVRVKRNGNLVAEFSQANATTTHIDDNGLREGATYLYTCEAFVDGLWAEGTNALQLSTLAVNAPVFSGIVNAVAQNTTTVRVTWTPSVVDIPVSAYSYKVYANIGPEVDWTIPPKATILHGSPGEFLVTNLGDELMYSFGVRACSEGDVCETNTVKRTISTPDGGAPQTVGVTNLAVQDGKLIITAPWNEQNGGISRRYVYVRTGATGGLNIGDYVLQRTYQLTGAQLYAPPQTLELPSIQEGITYHIIVQDEDPTGQRSTVTNFRTLTTTDITPPAFAGITALTVGTPSDTTLVATWTAIATEASDPAQGGVNYRILALNSPNPISTNPCLHGTQIAEIPVSNYTNGQTVNYNITALTQKTYYSVCVKAVDSLGNVSTNNNYQQNNTKDITAPEFFGIQNLAYSNQTGELQATWTPSASVDIKEYRLKIWKNSATPPPTPVTLVRSHASSASGTNVTSAEFSVTDGDQIYVNVEACDNTISPFGTQNCTATGIQRTLSLLDVTPPPNFLGIRGATDIETPSEGSFVVKWHAPADWSDYVGFKIYSVNPGDNSLSILNTCYCVTNSCVNPANRITQCSVSGLDPYRTYRLHVRAFDAQNNETIYLNPATSYSEKQTSDTTAPVFASNLVIGPAPDFILTWNAATDNQYASEPGAIIQYEVYQSNDHFDFSGPQPDGNLKLTTTDLTFQDSGFEEAQTYFYTVCAIDASGNRNCDQNERVVTIPDVTQPVIQNLTSNKTVKSKVWELSWEMEDNISDTENLFVEIRQRVSEAGDLATPSDTLIYSGLGSDVIISGNTASTAEAGSLNPLSGPANLRRKINYLVTISDEAGNTDSANITIDSDNILQLTEVKSQQGPIAGGKTVAIYGKGFTKASENAIGVSTTVSIGGKVCTDIEIISEEALLCTSPSATVTGSVEVRVRNQINSGGSPVYSEANIVNGYTYSSSYICDNPGTWGPNFAAGTGADASSAYIICNATHLNNVRNFATSGAYFKLGANIDLDGQTFNPIGVSVAKFTGNFNGDGHVISNWSHTTVTAVSGLFGYVAGNFQITNLGLVNVNLSGGQSTGGLIGVAEGGTNITALMSKVFVSGSIQGTDYVGGIVGRKQAPHLNFNLVNSYFVGTVTASGPTGYAGGVLGFTGLDNGGLFQNIYSEGTVSGTRFIGGLFGQLGTNKQLLTSYSRAQVQASESYAGGLVGESRLATINNSYSEASSVTGVDYVGGIAGYLSGNLNNSYSKTLVISTGTRSGGAVGLATTATIQNSRAEKNVNGNNSAGGFVGEATNSTLSNSYALGTVTSSGNDVGGFVGKISVEANQTSSLTQVYSKGLVNTTLSAVGGLVGTADLLDNSTLTMARVFSDSQVGTSFALPNQQYGGLVGKLNTRAGAQANISDCFASGDVYGGNYVGGLIGGYDNSAGIVRVRRCYSSATVYGSELGRGGLFGNTLVASHDILDTYWDTQKSTKAFASGNGSYTGTAQGYATATMLDYSNSIYVGWDFVGVWRIPTEGYPRLVFE